MTSFSRSSNSDKSFVYSCLIQWKRNVTKNQHKKDDEKFLFFSDCCCCTDTSTRKEIRFFFAFISLFAFNRSINIYPPHWIEVFQINRNINIILLFIYFIIMIWCQGSSPQRRAQYSCCCHHYHYHHCEDISQTTLSY